MTPLRQRMIEDMQVRNLSPLTQSTYVLQVSLFARYCGKPPDQLGPEEIRSYQVYLTNEKKLAPASVLIAVAALRFLYKVTLHKGWSLADIIPALRNPRNCPSFSARKRSGTFSVVWPVPSTGPSSRPVTPPGCESRRWSGCARLHR